MVSEWEKNALIFFSLLLNKILKDTINFDKKQFGISIHVHWRAVTMVVYQQRQTEPHPRCTAKKGESEWGGGGSSSDNFEYLKLQ